MKKSDIYYKLVDLYAGGELPSELEQELQLEAQSDPALLQEMTDLKKTVDLLHAEPAPEFTEESYQRILGKMYARGLELQQQAPEPSYLQYHLPLQG